MCRVSCFTWDFSVYATTCSLAPVYDVWWHVNGIMWKVKWKKKEEEDVNTMAYLICYERRKSISTSTQNVVKLTSQFVMCVRLAINARASLSNLQFQISRRNEAVCSISCGSPLPSFYLAALHLTNAHTRTHASSFIPSLTCIAHLNDCWPNNISATIRRVGFVYLSRTRHALRNNILPSICQASKYI